MKGLKIFASVCAVPLLFLIINAGIMYGNVQQTISEKPGGQIVFPDVDENYWAHDEIYTFVQAGLVEGYPDGTFKPQGNITRAEAVKILNGYQKYSGIGEKDFGYISANQDAALTREEAARALVLIADAEDELEFYDASKYLKYSDFCKVNENFKPYVAVTIEKGIIKGFEDNTLRMDKSVTRAEFVAMICRTLNPVLYVNTEQDRTAIVSDYNAGYNLGVTFERTGANNLPDFGYWYFFDKSIKNYDFKNAQAVKEPYTDYFSPYIVAAVNNADGDMPQSGDFTGGNHGYNNTGDCEIKTARNTAFRIFIDGKETSHYSGAARTVDICFSNRIQATNTKKNDGSGREVIEENINLRFDGDKWKFTTTVTALEDVYIKRYYGPQCDLCVFANKLVYVSKTGERTSVGLKGSSKSPGTDCNKIEIYGTFDAEIAVSNPVPEEFNSAGCSAFYESYGKSYFNIVNSDENPMLLKKGESFTLKGYYKFKQLS